MGKFTLETYNTAVLREGRDDVASEFPTWDPLTKVRYLLDNAWLLYVVSPKQKIPCVNQLVHSAKSDTRVGSAATPAKPAIVLDGTEPEIRRAILPRNDPFYKLRRDNFDVN